jgi:hypothetical protein
VEVFDSGQYEVLVDELQYPHRAALLPARRIHQLAARLLVVLAAVHLLRRPLHLLPPLAEQLGLQLRHDVQQNVLHDAHRVLRRLVLPRFQRQIRG